MESRGWEPHSTVRCFRRYGDWLDPRNVRGLGGPLAEVQADDGGLARFDPIRLEAGHPLWLVGTSPQGAPRAVRSSAPGDWVPRKEERPDGTAQQSQSQAVSQHVRADELPNVRSTSVHGPRTSRDAKPKPLPFDPEVVERMTDEQRAEVAAKVKEVAAKAKAKGRGKPTPRHQAPRPGEVGGPPLPQGPGYGDDLGPAAA